MLYDLDNGVYRANYAMEGNDVIEKLNTILENQREIFCYLKELDEYLAEENEEENLSVL